jgi:hypothetical protein
MNKDDYDLLRAFVGLLISETHGIKHFPNDCNPNVSEMQAHTMCRFWMQLVKNEREIVTNG